MTEEPKSYAEILGSLHELERTRFRNDVEFQEAALVTMYDALVALLTRLAAS